jgi:hypothetical protein
MTLVTNGAEPAMDQGEGERWLSVAEAAPQLDLTVDGLRSRIKRGQVTTRRSNSGRLLVSVAMNGSDPGHDHSRELAPNGSDHSHDQGHEPAANGSVEPDHDLLSDLLAARERAARAEGELAAEARRSTDLMAVITDLRADRDRLAAELALARKGWLERLLEAVRGR